jgi:uncharacterized protein DUF6897
VRNFLESRIGHEIDVHCGTDTISGKVTKVEGQVLYLEKDDVTCYVNIDKIIAVWDAREKKGPPGFLSTARD